MRWVLKVRIAKSFNWLIDIVRCFGINSKLSITVPVRRKTVISFIISQGRCNTSEILTPIIYSSIFKNLSFMLYVTIWSDYVCYDFVGIVIAYSRYRDFIFVVWDFLLWDFLQSIPSWISELPEVCLTILTSIRSHRHCNRYLMAFSDIQGPSISWIA